MMNRIHRLAIGAIGAMVCTIVIGSGCRPKRVQTNPVDDLEQFVRSARAESPVATAEGSLWVDRSSYADLARDFKARNVNDIVTIQVLERTQASATADATNSRNSTAEAGFDGLFGLEGRISELGSLVSGSSENSFEGRGSTTRSNTLSTSLTARVTEVLPNGYLVIEGVRAIQINDEDQIVTIRGVLRPQDISPGNVIPSSAVAQMEVTVAGKGIVSKPLRPGWLYQILSGFLPF